MVLTICLDVVNMVDSQHIRRRAVRDTASLTAPSSVVFNFSSDLSPIVRIGVLIVAVEGLVSGRVAEAHLISPFRLKDEWLSYSAVPGEGSVAEGTVVKEDVVA